MKNESGITLIVLVIVIAVMLILASVALKSGTESINNTLLKGFYTQLEIVEKRVDEIASNDEYYIDENGKTIYLIKAGLAKSDTDFPWDILTKILSAEGGNPNDDYVEEFRYFTKDEVKTILGIKNIDYSLFINFDERIVIAKEGITLGNKTYYMLESTTYFVKHYSETEKDVDFTVSAKKLTDGKYKIVIIPKNTGNSIIKYKEVSTKYWEKTNELEINVTDTLPKYFDIQYKDLSIDKSITKSYGIYLDKNNDVQIALTEDIELEEGKMVEFTINPSPNDATVIINGHLTNSVQVVTGSKVKWFVYKSGYELQYGENKIDGDENILLQKTLESKKQITESVESYASYATTTFGSSITFTDLEKSYDWDPDDTSWKTTYAQVKITSSGYGDIYNYQNFKTVKDGITYENFSFLPDNATITKIKVVVSSSLPTYGKEIILVRRYDLDGKFTDASDWLTYKYTTSSGLAVTRNTTSTGNEQTKGTDGISASNISSGLYGKWIVEEFKNNYFKVVLRYKARNNGTKYFYPRYVATELTYEYIDVIDATEITLDNDSINLSVNNTAKLTATITPTNVTEKNIMWTSNDEQVATVDDDGVITAIKEGSSIITATTVNGLQANCLVTVQ